MSIEVDLSQAPVVFSKFATALTGHGKPVELPRASAKVDYEAELVVVIGKSGRHVNEGDAMSYVAGYTIINVKSSEEAIEWTKRFPNPSIDGGEAEIEVRQYFELEDFGESDQIERFREIGVGGKR